MINFVSHQVVTNIEKQENCNQNLILSKSWFIVKFDHRLCVIGEIFSTVFQLPSTIIYDNTRCISCYNNRSVQLSAKGCNVWWSLVL